MRKFISLFLVAALCMGLCTFVAGADNNGVHDEPVYDEYVSEESYEEISYEISDEEIPEDCPVTPSDDNLAAGKD